MGGRHGLLDAGCPHWFGQPRLGALRHYHAALVLAAAAVSIFPCGWWGPGIISIAAAGELFSWRGFWSVVIGLCLGAVLALGKMLREGSVCQRFLYLTAYIRRFIQSKEIEAYYCRSGMDISA